MRMIGEANNTNKNITPDMNIALYLAVNNTLCDARSGCFAPRFWPTNVAAALLKPQAGRIKNTALRSAIWYPELASFPPISATSLVSMIQLPEAIKNCTTAGQETFMIDLIKGQSQL